MTISAAKQAMIAGLKPGDRIWRWWDDGISGVQNPFTVVRVNRTTVTVENNRGKHIRLPHAEIEGRVDWDEESKT